MVALTTSLRPMVAADVPEVAALERRAFSDPWSERALAEELELADRRYVVACAEGIVGYGGSMILGDEAHVLTLAVDPVRRRRGIATRLLLWLIDEAVGSGVHHLTLEVRVSNEAARGLYERFGFTAAGRRRRYYRDEDALIMWSADLGSDAARRRLQMIREEVG
jgi:ribosomal-protein-alanine N-acetyltransferase